MCLCAVCVWRYTYEIVQCERDGVVSLVCVHTACGAGEGSMSRLSSACDSLWKPSAHKNAQYFVVGTAEGAVASELDLSSVSRLWRTACSRAACGTILAAAGKMHSPRLHW